MSVVDALLGVSGLVLGLLVVWVLHAKVGKYPEPQRPSENRARDIGEVLVLFVVLLLFGFLMAYVYVPFIDKAGLNFTKRTVTGVLVRIIPEFLLPLALILPVGRWTFKDLGFTLRVRSWPAAVFALVFGLVLGAARLFPNGVFDPPDAMPVDFLVMMFIQSALMEDFTYRAVMQTKLEAALGQRRAVILSGILFGLAHLGANVHSMGLDFRWGELIYASLGQMIVGWVLGITYMKTRSLWPQAICHYSLNWLANIVAWFV